MAVDKAKAWLEAIGNQQVERSDIPDERSESGSSGMAFGKAEAWREAIGNQQVERSDIQPNSVWAACRLAPFGAASN